MADERESYHKRFFPPAPSAHLRGPVSGAADWRRRRYFRGVGQWQRRRPNQYLCGETPGGPQMRNTSADLGPGSHIDHIFYPLLHGPFCGLRFFSPTPLALLRPSVRSFHATRFTCLLACLTGSIISACPKCSSPLASPKASGSRYFTYLPTLTHLVIAGEKMEVNLIVHLQAPRCSQ